MAGCTPRAAHCGALLFAAPLTFTTATAVFTAATMAVSVFAVLVMPMASRARAAPMLALAVMVMMAAAVPFAPVTVFFMRPPAFPAVHSGAVRDVPVFPTAVASAMMAAPFAFGQGGFQRSGQLFQQRGQLFRFPFLQTGKQGLRLFPARLFHGRAHVPARVRDKDPAGTLVLFILAAFHQPLGFEPVQHFTQRGRLNAQNPGQVFLAHAVPVRQNAQYAPLSTVRAVPAAPVMAVPPVQHHHATVQLKNELFLCCMIH